MSLNLKYILLLFCLLACCSAVCGDRLPQGVAENQVWTTTSLVEGVGVTIEDTDLVWHLGDASLTELGLDIEIGDWYYFLGNPWPAYVTTPVTYHYDRGRSIAYMMYKDSIMSNGGQISEVKSFSLDTNAKTEGLYNVETEKVLTYTSQNGSHLMGTESYILDVAGMWQLLNPDDIVCVFARSSTEMIPAFCNKVTAASRLRSINTAQIESIGAATVVGKDIKTPAALSYEIAVTPDGNSASGYADGIVSTTFTVSVMEGRNDFWKGDPLAGVGRRQFLYDPLGLIFGAASFSQGWEMNDQDNLSPIDWLNVQYFPDPMGDYVEITYVMDDGRWYEYTSWDAASHPITGVILGQLPIYEYDFGTGLATLADNPPIMIEVTPEGDFILSFSTGASYYLSGTNRDPITGFRLMIDGWDELASTFTTTDTATVSGGISNFVKAFNYKSGVKCSNC